MALRCGGLLRRRIGLNTVLVGVGWLVLRQRRLDRRGLKWIRLNDVLGVGRWLCGRPGGLDRGRMGAIRQRDVGDRGRCLCLGAGILTGRGIDALWYGSLAGGRRVVDA